MARHRGSRRGGGFAAASRQTRWLDIPWTVSVLSTTSSAVLALTLTAAELALRPFTIVRTRGILHVTSDQFVAAETARISLGLAVVSDQAVAIGVTAVPTPETDRASDLWFVYESLGSSFVIASNSGFTEPTGRLLHWDSKAMRKVEEGQDVAVVLENSALSSNGSITEVAGRMLIKLH